MKKNFEKLKDKIVDKYDSSYEKDRESWNRSIDVKPKAIIYCEDEKDVAYVLKVIKEKNLEFRIRSGRHHYEGFSIGENIVVLDISKMQNIELDEEKKIVKIGAGVRNKELYNELNSRGYPFSGGGCPTVGVVGYTLGGGWGYSSRYLGLGSDNVISCEMIDSNGNIIFASKEKNKDLFWALMGSGVGNFGVVTSIIYKLPEKTGNVSLVLFKYSMDNIEEKIKIVQVLQKEFKTMDERFNAKTSVYNSKENGTGVYITGIFYGKKEEAEKALTSFKNIVSFEDLKIEEMSILEANDYIQDSHPEYEHYKSGGRFLYKDLSKEEIGKMLEFTEKRPEGSVYVAVSFYGLGGVVDNFTNNDMSYANRGAKFIIGVQSVWEDNKYKNINSESVLKTYNYIKTLTKGSYIAFPIKELENYEYEFFGENLEQIKIIKRKYDKDDFFKYPQSIKI